MITFNDLDKDPTKGGLYIHLIQPKRKIEEPGKIIEPGMSVVKPGKFNGSLNGRMKDYYSPKYWHFTDTKEPAFKLSVTISHLILDAQDFPVEQRWLIAGLEVKLFELVKEKFNVIGKIGKGNSEYRELEFSDLENYNNIVRKISDELKKIVQVNLGY